MTNRSMPDGVFIPELAYTSVPEAAEWLCRAFGFKERLRIADHRAQLSFGAGSMVVTEGGRAHASVPSAADDSHGVMVRVPNVDEHCERATRAGAKILRAPADHPFGERQYTAIDLGGHRWTFSQTIADSDPASWGGRLVEL